MKKDPTQFRERFNRWKSGKKVYEAGKPIESYEEGATNAELRYSYSDNGRLHGKELDDVIDGLSWTNLTTRLQNINGYGNNFVKNLNSKMRGMSVEEKREFKAATLAKIKHAMKYVGMFSGAAYVGSQMQSNDRKINKPQIR